MKKLRYGVLGLASVVTLSVFAAGNCWRTTPMYVCLAYEDYCTNINGKSGRFISGGVTFDGCLGDVPTGYYNCTDAQAGCMDEGTYIGYPCEDCSCDHEVVGAYTRYNVAPIASPEGPGCGDVQARL